MSAADPTVLEDLRGLVEPAIMGDPMRPLLWVSKSREKLAVALRAMNHAVSANTVAKMLTALGFSRQVNRKTKGDSRLSRARDPLPPLPPALPVIVDWPDCEWV